MSDDLLMQPGDTVDSAHYLRALTDMADKRAVIAESAIYTDNGIKLVEKGARVDSRLYDRLVQHKLRDPIDSSLSVDQPVDAAALLEAAQQLLDSRVLPQLLSQALDGPTRLLAPIRSMPLTPSIAFKLTVMRDQRRPLFEHSLEMMLVAVFLAIKSGVAERDSVAVAAAALLHDLGVLHMDPAWSDPDHRVTGAKRKHLAAHPITAMLLIRDAKAYPRSVEAAVLEHHERMDGSGYPRGVMGETISPLGRILVLAEVVAAFYEKYEDIPAQRLSLVLRLNHRKFPQDLVVHVLALLRDQMGHESELAPLGADAPSQIDLLAEVFLRWDQARSSLPQAALQPASTGCAAFIDLRLNALHKALIEAGAHPNHEVLQQLKGDIAGMAEVALVGREALWQLQSIINACTRRWPDLAQRQTPEDAAVADWCDWVLRQL